MCQVDKMISKRNDDAMKLVGLNSRKEKKQIRSKAEWVEEEDDDAMKLVERIQTKKN